MFHPRRVPEDEHTREDAIMAERPNELQTNSSDTQSVIDPWDASEWKSSFPSPPPARVQN